MAQPQCPTVFKAKLRTHRNPPPERLAMVVGARGFEPRTPCAQGRCATRLRYAPTFNDLRYVQSCCNHRGRCAIWARIVPVCGIRNATEIQKKFGGVRVRPRVRSLGHVTLSEELHNR